MSEKIPEYGTCDHDLRLTTRNMPRGPKKVCAECIKPAMREKQQHHTEADKVAFAAGQQRVATGKRVFKIRRNANFSTPSGTTFSNLGAPTDADLEDYKMYRTRCANEYPIVETPLTFNAWRTYKKENGQ